MERNLESNSAVANSQAENKKDSYLKFCYKYLVSDAMYLLFVPFFAILLSHISAFSIDDLRSLMRFRVRTLALFSALVALFITLYLMSKPRKVYLVDFSCCKPKPSFKITRERYMQLCADFGYFTDDSLNFLNKITEKSGFGEMTYAPKGLTELPQDQSMFESRNEAEMVMFEAIDELLLKTGVSPGDVGILVVNSSLFNPVPSLASMIVNRFKLRGNILSYNLAGMGCSASLISVDLAKQLLQVHANSYALVVSTENITRNWYKGNERSKLLTNCLFRVGAAAVLLSNRPSDRPRSKYQLHHIVRTHKGSDDKCYASVTQEEDENQVVGVSLSRDLMQIAGEALKANITTLGPLVLPFSEQLLYMATLVAKRVFKIKIKTYIPNFKLAFEHLCVHAGGRGVLDAIEKHLELSPQHMEPSRMTLYRFGNTSSSSLWYELSYSEAKGIVEKGHRVWQIGFGSGFKCNSAVWIALKTINPRNGINPWLDEINDFPVHVPKVAPIG